MCVCLSQKRPVWIDPRARPTLVSVSLSIIEPEIIDPERVTRSTVAEGGGFLESREETQKPCFWITMSPVAGEKMVHRRT